jgi:dihydroneopterin aldolase
MYTIHLQNLRFTGYHGLYEAEKVVGNEFEVQVAIRVSTEPESASADVLSLDYVQAYAIIRECMEEPTPLLEQLAMKIVRKLLLSFPPAESVHISLFKLHPPIPAFEGKVGVEFDINRKNIPLP